MFCTFRPFKTGTLLFMKKEVLVIAGFLFIFLALKLGIRIFIVTSGSMEPHLKTGSVVITSSKSKYLKGDVIAFKSSNYLIVHRIESVSQESFITKGDANTTADVKLVSQKQVLGKVFFSLPYVGYFLKFCLTFPGFLMLVVFPTVLVLLSLRA